MKLLHTSDLHLGKRVNEYAMLDDQAFILKRIGFGKARSIGGISGYRGTLEK